MSKRKVKNVVDVENAIELLHAYGILVTVMNSYQWRLNVEGDDVDLFDWYHTTGSLVHVNRDTGFMKSLGKIVNVEEIAILIKKML